MVGWDGVASAADEAEEAYRGSAATAAGRRKSKISGDVFMVDRMRWLAESSEGEAQYMDGWWTACSVQGTARPGRGSASLRTTKTQCQREVYLGEAASDGGSDLTRELEGRRGGKRKGR